jgi:hypothetical protein
MNRVFEAAEIGALSEAMQNTLGGYFTDEIAVRFIIDYVPILIRRGYHVR